MSTWNQVRHITQFELYRNGITPLLLFVYAGILLVVFASDPLIHREIYADIIFLALFSGAFTMFARPDGFKLQMINQKVAVTYPVLLLQQFPASNEAITTSRFIIHNVYNIVFQSLFIIPYYAFVPAFRELMPIQTFIVFFVMWVSIGIFASGSSTPEDAGKPTTTRDRKALIRLIVQLTLLIGSLVSLYVFTPHTLMSGSIVLAKEFPITSCILAGIIAWTGIFYGQRKMNRTLQTTDYL